jgi:hypothetical protein
VTTIPNNAHWRNYKLALKAKSEGLNGVPSALRSTLTDSPVVDFSFDDPKSISAFFEDPEVREYVRSFETIIILDPIFPQDIPTSKECPGRVLVVLVPPRVVNLERYERTMELLAANLIITARKAEKTYHAVFVGPALMVFHFMEGTGSLTQVVGRCQDDSIPPTRGPDVYPTGALRILCAGAHLVRIVSGPVQYLLWRARDGLPDEANAFQVISTPEAVENWWHHLRRYASDGTSIVASGNSTPAEDRAVVVTRYAAEQEKRLNDLEWDESDRAQEIDDEVQRRLAAEMRKRGML